MKRVYLLTAFVAISALTFSSCAKTKLHSSGINSQTQRVDTRLKRTDYTLMDQQFQFTVENKKEYKRLTLDQLKEVAFTGAEKEAIMGGADGVLNPVFAVDQRKSKYIVTARVKGYKLKTDNEYLDMENSLKYNPN